MESKMNKGSDIINAVIVGVVIVFVVVACVLAVLAIRDNKETQDIAEDSAIESTKGSQPNGLIQLNKEEVEREFVVAYIIEETVDREQLTKLAMLFQDRTREYLSDAFIQYGEYEGKILIGVRLPEGELEAVSEDTREFLAKRMIEDTELKFILGYGTDHERTILEGKDIQNATSSMYQYDYGTQDYIVEIQFTEEGAEILEKETNEHIGESLWIVYDGNVICAPRITAAIPGGKACINGLNGNEEADNIANAINLMPFDYSFTRVR